MTTKRTNHSTADPVWLPPTDTVLYAPEVAAARARAPDDHDLWHSLLLTPSLCATGYTRAGTKVVVYAHIPHHYVRTTELRNALLTEQLRNGAVPLPQPEFDRLVALDGLRDEQRIQRVSVLDYDSHRRARCGTVSLESAATHPQTAAFLGGPELMREYLHVHAIAYRANDVGLWHMDLVDDTVPLAHFLVFGRSSFSGLKASVPVDETAPVLVAAYGSQRAPRAPYLKRP